MDKEYKKTIGVLINEFRKLSGSGNESSLCLILRALAPVVGICREVEELMLSALQQDNRNEHVEYFTLQALSGRSGDPVVARKVAEWLRTRAHTAWSHEMQVEIAKVARTLLLESTAPDTVELVEFIISEQKPVYPEETRVRLIPILAKYFGTTRAETRKALLTCLWSGSRTIREAARAVLDPLREKFSEVDAVLWVAE